MVPRVPSLPRMAELQAELAVGTDAGNWIVGPPAVGISCFPTEVFRSVGRLLLKEHGPLGLRFGQRGLMLLECRRGLPFPLWACGDGDFAVAEAGLVQAVCGLWGPVLAAPSATLLGSHLAFPPGEIWKALGATFCMNF